MTPDHLPRNLRRRVAVERAHLPYWNDVLGEEYCHADGEPWPCLHYRRGRPAKCKCSHVRHAGQCWSAACGCREYRPVVETPAEHDGDIDASIARHPAGKGPKRTDGGPSLREYLESKGEL